MTNDEPPREPSPKRGPNPVHVARDVCLFFALTVAGGILVDLLAKRSGKAIAISYILLGVAAFTIAGCLKKVKHWNHLGWVAAVCCLVTFVKVAFDGIPLTARVIGLVPILVMMGVGGTIASIIKKKNAR
jgi:hypothetical protein